MKTLISKLKHLPRHGQTGPTVPAGPALNFIDEDSINTPVPVSTDTFTVFGSDDVVTNSKQTVTAGLWSDGVGSLTTFFTASAQTTSQRRYYVDIYDDTPSADGSSVQFSAAYGHALGSGSSELGTEENPASKAVYAQYKSLLLEKNASRFITAGSGSTDSIYVINVNIICKPLTKSCRCT